MSILKKKIQTEYITFKLTVGYKVEEVWGYIVKHK